MRQPSALALLVLLALGCNERNAPHSDESENVPSQREAPALLEVRSVPDAASAAPASSPEPLPAAAHVAPHMRVAAVVGKLESEGVTLRAGLELGEPHLLRLAPGQSVTLSLGDFARVQIVGPALAQVLPDKEPAVLLHDGLVTLDVAPRGLRSVASAFWLATPSLRFDVPDSVRVAVRAFPNAASELAVVSGYLTVSQPGKPLAVPGGSSVCVTLVEAKLVKLKLDTLEQARAKLGKATSCAPRTRQDDQALEQARQRALSAFASATQLEQEQLAEHSRQVEVDAGRAIQLREELSHLGVELSHLGELSRGLEAQHKARALAQQPSSFKGPGDKTR